MKKILFLSLLIAATMVGFASCDDDDDKDDPSFLGANVEVTVTNVLGEPIEGRTVYLYKDTPVTDETLPADAKKVIVTDSVGIARFNLNFTELNLLESQTSLYFAVFYTLDGKTYVVDSGGITVKRNQSKQIELKMPI